MRTIVAALVMVGVPVLAAAQSVPHASHAAPLPTIGLPLPPIGLPLPTIGLPRAIDTHTSVNEGRRPHGIEQQRGQSGERKQVRSNRTLLYFVPTYGSDHPHAARDATPTPGVPDGPSRHREPSPLTGNLRLELQPDRIVQLYVDGYFVGTWDDVNGELALEAGPHRIEMRAPGYETVDVNVRIAPGRSITYRGTLTPVDAKTTPQPTVEATGVAPAPKTVYFIPGCYLGNVPPKDARLPASCDQSRVTTFEP